MFWGPSKSRGPVPMASMAPIDKMSLFVEFKNINTSLVTEKQNDKKKVMAKHFQVPKFYAKREILSSKKC